MARTASDVIRDRDEMLGDGESSGRRIRNVHFVPKGGQAYRTAHDSDHGQRVQRSSGGLPDDYRTYDQEGRFGLEQDYDLRTGEERSPFVGIPPGYYPENGNFDPRTDRIPAAYLRTPLYREEDLVDALGWTPERVWQMQQDLVEAGFLETGFRKGFVGGQDDPTFTAYADLLTFANTKGITVDKALMMARRNYREHRNAFGPEGNPRTRSSSGAGGDLEPLPTFIEPDFQSPNVEDLESTVEAFAREYIGREPTDEEISRLVDRFESNYRAAHEIEVERARAEFDRMVEYDEVQGRFDEPSEQGQEFFSEGEEALAAYRGEIDDPAEGQRAGGGTLESREVPAEMNVDAANRRDLRSFFRRSLAGVREKQAQDQQGQVSEAATDVFDSLIGGRF